MCQSLLAPSRTDDQRLQVRQRAIDVNTVLRQECGPYANCRFDGNAVFSYRFTRSDVSSLDYFHPSLTEQAHLAEITWRAGSWG